MNKKPFNARTLYRLGFTRREDLDFADDGNYFRGYEYKGVPVSFLNSHSDFGAIFLDFRPDELDFRYELHSKMSTCQLQGKYNGCCSTNVNADELQADAETIYQDFVNSGLLPAPEEKTSASENRTFSVTGSIPGYKSRQAFINELIESGWEFHKTLKATTDFFFMGNKATQHKVDKARAIGVEVTRDFAMA